MPRSMRKYHIDKIKSEKHSFIASRDFAYTYAKYGKLMGYANKTQANKRCEELKKMGFDCCVTFEWPFLIISDFEGGRRVRCGNPAGEPIR